MHTAANKTLGRCFLKELMTKCKKSNESGLKQRKAILNAPLVGYATSPSFVTCSHVFSCTWDQLHICFESSDWFIAESLQRQIL